MPTCLIYKRVSTGKQALEGVSLEMQEQLLLKYAYEQGYDNTTILIYSDAGISGGSIRKRRGLLGLIEYALVKKNNVDLILTYAQARMWRNAEDGFYIQRIFAKAKVPIYSLSEARNLIDAKNKLTSRLISVIDEEEIDRTRIRTASALASLKDAGKVYGKVPYGFTNTPGELIGDRIRNKMLVVNDTEVPLVKQVFALSRMHKKSGTRAVASKLNDAGLKTRSGGKFFPSTIDRILSNEELYKKYGII